MKLTDERIKRLGDEYRAILDHNIAVPMAAVHIVDLCDTIQALQQENEQLQAQTARMREVISKVQWIDNYNGNGEQHCIFCTGTPFQGHRDCCKLNKALSTTPADYHNPADVEALKQARELFLHYHETYCGSDYCDEGCNVEDCKFGDIGSYLMSNFSDNGDWIGGKKDE